MSYKSKYGIVVNGVPFPLPAHDGYEVTKRKLNAYAERTPKTMRIGQLGDVWEIKYTFPANMPEGTYRDIYNALEPFVVEINFYNTFTEERMTTTFYHSDITVKRLMKEVNQPVEITFIGTEVM